MRGSELQPTVRESPLEQPHGEQRAAARGGARTMRRLTLSTAAREATLAALVASALCGRHGTGAKQASPEAVIRHFVRKRCVRMKVR